MDDCGHPNYCCGAARTRVLFLNPLGGGGLAEEANTFILFAIDFLQSFLRRRRIHHSLFTDAITQGKLPPWATLFWLKWQRRHWRIMFLWKRLTGSERSVAQTGDKVFNRSAGK